MKKFLEIYILLAICLICSLEFDNLLYEFYLLINCIIPCLILKIINKNDKK